MSTRCLCALLALAALVAGTFPAFAKPPDLPAKFKFDCQEAESTPSASAPIEKAGKAGIAEEEADGYQQTSGDLTIDAVSPFFCEWLRACGEKLSHYFDLKAGAEEAEAGTTQSAPVFHTVDTEGVERIGVDFGNACGETKSRAAVSEYTCPYLRQKEAARHQASANMTEMPGSVLDNLKKLEQAAEIYRKAEDLRRSGQTEEARLAYEQVKQLCPGSRYDGLASQRLQQVAAPKATSTGEIGAEEQEAPGDARTFFWPTKRRDAASTAEEQKAPGDTRKSRKESRVPTKPGENKVATLLAHCQGACRAGQYGTALQLLELAWRLDSDGVQADPLVYKMHLLVFLGENLSAGLTISQSRPEAHLSDLLQAAIQACQEVFPKAESSTTVRDCQKILPEVEERRKSETVLEIEEKGSTQEAEGQCKPSEILESAMPDLFVDPPPGDLMIQKKSQE